MQLSKKILTGIAISGAIILSPAVASAHVVVKPVKVAPAEYQTFTTSVPNEKNVAVTGIRLVIPNDVESVTPTVKPGWNIETKKSGDTITEIVWTGGTIDAGLRDDFTFSAQAPAKEGSITWKAYQTYADGSVVAWDQKPSDEHGHEDESKGPYSITGVSDTEEASDTTTSNSSTGAYILSGVALAIAIIAFARVAKRN